MRVFEFAIYLPLGGEGNLTSTVKAPCKVTKGALGTTNPDEIFNNMKDPQAAPAYSYTCLLTLIYSGSVMLR